MRKVPTEKIKMTGDIPSPRFGHTFTLISKSKAVLFGGAVSVAGTSLLTQANSSSPTKLSSMTSRPATGRN